MMIIKPLKANKETKGYKMFSTLSKTLLGNNKELAEKVNASSNPYLAARLEWNYLFGDIRKAKQQWAIVATFSLIANLFLILGLITLALQTTIKPYVVKVDQLGNALYGGFLDKEKTITPLEINAFIRQYVMNARSVTTDAFAEKRAIDAVYSASLPPARKLLDTFYREANPFVIAKQNLIEVQIKGVIQKSSHTWQVNWLEVHRSVDGEPLEEHHFEALITVSHMTVKNPELLNTNPLGIYIQQINWAEQE